MANFRMPFGKKPTPSNQKGRQVKLKRADGSTLTMPIKLTRQERKAMNPQERRKYLFVTLPVWKSLLIMAWPALVQMFVVGAYSFADSLLAINFAADSYGAINLPNGEIYSATAQVRLFMFSVAPMINLLNSVAVLFSVGMATRISVNLGQGNIDRARAALRVGTTVSLSLSFLLIPALVFSIKPWISAQFSSFPPALLSAIEENGYRFVVILVISYPVQAFYQINSGIFRVDGRNRELLIINVLPLFLNLLLDWVFMGPVGMSVEGGAWATLIANAVSCLLCVYFILRTKSDVLKFRYMFGWKIRWIAIVGVILAGLTPFFRQFSQSITQLVEQNAAQAVSQAVYGDVSRMGNISSGALIVFGLFFPIIFGFTQAARPIASYNYGAKQYKKVAQSFWITVLYATIAGVLLYILGAVALVDPLMTLLNVGDANREATIMVLRIIMTSMPIFAIAVAGMTYFGSIDRIAFSIISAIMRGFILLFPVMYGFQALAIANPSQVFIYWAYYPILTIATSTVILLMSFYTLRTMSQETTTFYFYVPRKWVRHIPVYAEVKTRFGIQWVRKEVYYLTIAFSYIKLDGSDHRRIYYPHLARRVARFEHITFDERVDRIYAWNDARRERKLMRKNSSMD